MSDETRILGRNLRKEHVYIAVILALIVSNIWAISSDRKIDGTVSESFVDSVRATGNGFGNIFNEFEDMMEDSTLTAEEVEDLKYWVDRTKVHSASVTYQDSFHPYLWERTTVSLGQFEAFLDDLKMAVNVQDALNKTAYMSERDRTRLGDVMSRLEAVYRIIYPNGSSHEIMWATPHHEEYETVMEAWHYFDAAVGEAWKVIPSIRQVDNLDPENQARIMLIDSVGEDYFNKYFKQWKVEINERNPEDWLTSVGYFYYIEAGDYTYRAEISIHFDKMNELIGSYGLPEKGNLMPFTVTKEDAIEFALDEVSKSYVEVDANIYYRTKTYDDTRIRKYVWHVVFYHTPRRASSGESTLVYVDPHSGEIYGVEESMWATA